jgi:transposase
MAMGRRNREKQAEIWIDYTRIPKSPGHPFYERLGKILSARKFDDFVEELCAKFYAEKMGRPSIPPGVYFRMLMIGYFEGLDSERGIAWRCADSLSLKEFLGYSIDEKPPDHSSVSRTRRLLDLETHATVFQWVLKALAEEGLIRGRTVGIDATTLEANAALRSIVRRDTGESYTEFLARLARASGMETPTREDLARLDRKRKKKGSNEDWEHPHDPDARIARMKDGRTHMAHKDEQAVDLDTGAVLAVTVRAADSGDTETVSETLSATAKNVSALRDDPAVSDKIDSEPLSEVVADKGYHSNDVLEKLSGHGIRTYISEPSRGRRKWKGRRGARDAVYANRRRIRGRRGRRLMRRRAELVERSFAHQLETGGMRRTHLRGRENILKRLLIHAGGFNLGLLMRKVFGVGTPRRLDGSISLSERLVCAVRSLCGRLKASALLFNAWRFSRRRPGIGLAVA